MPMFYMELAVGQYFSLGPIGTWGAVCPLFQGKMNPAFMLRLLYIVLAFQKCLFLTLYTLYRVKYSLNTPTVSNN